MERKPDWLPDFPVQIYCNSEVQWKKRNIARVIDYIIEACRVHCKME